ncbi:MAG: sulfurtransferase [Ectothiorhodospiraceae bacterium]|nr:sulfurtransferase [Ectothiorhodospiraceae bacterium]
MNPGPLISATELLTLCRDADPPLLVDCRHQLDAPDAGEAAYRDGHLPGAVHARLDRDLSDPPGPATGRHPLPARDAAAARLGALGIGEDTHVVGYDDLGGAMAARLWWMLLWLGHTRVQVLDGGLRAWLEAGGGLEAGQVDPVPRELPIRAPQLGTCDQQEIQRAVIRGQGQPLRLVDVRTGERFQGITEPLDPVAGHVPGARNLPYTLALDPETRFRSPQELRALFSGHQLDQAPDQVVLMCGSGVSACHTLLAMWQAGLSGARLYPGSWSEWIRNPDNPVATGEEI